MKLIILMLTLIMLSDFCADPVTGKSDDKVTSEESESSQSQSNLELKTFNTSQKFKTSDEQEETATVNTENLHNYLINLGESLAARIQKGKSRYSHYLLKDLYKYYNALDEVSTLLMRSSAEEYEEGQRLFKLLNETNGPAHLKIPIDYVKLEKTFKWNDKHQTEELKEVFHETRFLWDYCVKLAGGKRELYTDKRKGRIGDECELSDIS